MKRYSIFSIANQNFAIDIDLVKEVFHLPRITSLPTTDSFLKGVFNLRGVIVPLLEIGSLLGIERPDTSGPVTALIIDYRKNLLGLAVEKVSDFITIDEAKIKATSSQSPVQVHSVLRGVHENNTLGQIFLIDAQKLFQLSETVCLQSSKV